MIDPPENAGSDALIAVAKEESLVREGTSEWQSIPLKKQI